VKACLITTVIEQNIKAAGHGNEEFLQDFVRMSTTLSPARHVVEVVNTRDLKRNVPRRFYKC